MQIFEALLFKGARLRGRIAMKHGRARHVALLEPHGEAFLEVDGGKQNHGFHFRKLAINASPSRWLFSGWNCVPTMLSRADDRGERAAIFRLRHEIRRLRGLELV